jgi:hypothetical protein
VFSGVFIAEDVNGVGNKGSGDTTVVDVQTLGQAFLNLYLKSACFLCEAFSLSLFVCVCARAKLPVLGLNSSNAGLSRFANHWTLD